MNRIMEPDMPYYHIPAPLSPGELDHLMYMMNFIDKLHYSYLHTHESLQKLDDKKRLEGYIREYLMVAPHDKKFVYTETMMILHRSAHHKENFSGIRASAAWSAIGAYAHNLLAQSWRKEFREIQTHSGYYKHNVERGLLDSNLMLRLMGYTEIAQGIFVLEGPVDPDRVANVSRDSFVAMVECEILCTLYEELLKRGCNYTWFEILEFREKHSCSFDEALHGLMFLYSQRCLSSCQTDCYSKCGIADRSTSMYNPNPYRIPNTVQVPYYNDTTDGLPMYGPHYGGNPRQSCSTYAKDYASPIIPILPRQANACSVPTGQLIELDASYTSNDNYTYDTDNYQKIYSDKVATSNPGTNTSSLNISDGNSNQLKYKINKDAGIDTWGASYQAPESKKNAKYDLVPNKNKVDDLEELFKSLGKDGAQPSCSTSEPKPSEKLNQKSARKKNKADSSTSNMGLSQTLSRETTKKPDMNYMSLKVKLSDKWDCPTCTFHNSNDKDVCEMCSRSKTSGNEAQPLVSGGRQCPKCTLVNEKGVTICDACGENLKDSPTYI